MGPCCWRASTITAVIAVMLVNGGGSAPMNTTLVATSSRSSRAIIFGGAEPTLFGESVMLVIGETGFQRGRLGRGTASYTAFPPVPTFALARLVETARKGVAFGRC